MFQAHIGDEARVTELVKRAFVRRTKGGDDPHKDPEGVIERPDQYQVHASTEILCKDIADKLTKHYPGWSWAVQPDERGKVVNIFCWNLHDQWGYTIRAVDIMNDPRRREAVRAGGEILRRFRAKPQRLNADALAEVMWEPGKNRAIPMLDDKVASPQQMARQKLREAIKRQKVQYHEMGGKVYAKVEE